MKLTVRFAVVLLVASMSSLVFGQDLQDKFFDSNGVRIRYVEQGTGEPIVLIHAYTLNAERNWVTPGIFQQLAKSYRVIALDCRGHGKSDKPLDVKQYGQEMVLDIVRLLDHLKIRQAHIVGYSMGGMITAKLLATKTERVLTASLGGTIGLLAPTEQEVKFFEQRAAEYEKNPTRTDSTNNVKVITTVYRSFPDLAVTEEQLAVVKVPTITIIGTADPAIEKVNKLKKVLSGLKVVTIEGATHTGERGAFSQPEFVQALEEFLKAHPSKKGR